MRAPKREHEATLVRQDDGSTWAPDAVLAIQPSHSWAVTQHPVEEGVDVSDHMQRQPTGFALRCTVTENPTKLGGIVGGITHLQERINWLRDTADAGRLVDIVTRRLGTYTGYLITSLPLLGNNVAKLTFDLMLKEVRQGSTTNILINIAALADDVATGARPEADVGEQATTSTNNADATARDEAAAAADQSALAGLLASL